ncbi:MAG TPA: ABC transporter ATP-binding protein [Limnochordia bacterium]
MPGHDSDSRRRKGDEQPDGRPATGPAPKETTERRTAWRYLPWFFGVLWRTRPFALALHVGLMAADGLVPAAQLLIAQYLLDAVASLAAGTGSIAVVGRWIGALVAVRVAQALVAAGRNITRAYVREKASWRLQELVVERSGRVPLEEYEQPEFFDRLQRAQQASVWRSFVIFESALRTIELAINLASFLVLLIGAHIALPLLLVGGATPTLISHIRRGRETYQLYRWQTPEQRRANYLVQLLTNREAAKELRLYGLGEHLLARWDELAGRLRRERMQLILRQQVYLGAARFASIAGYSGAVLLLLWLGVRGEVTLGAFVALSQAASRFQGQLGQLLRTVGQVYEELLYIADLQEFTATQATDEPAARPTGACSGEIVCERVSFAYPGGEPVLRDITFTLQPGEKVALVGENGAGKSTLIKLLLGLYRPTSGRILLGGNDLGAIDPDSFRSHAAAVFQDFLRYQLTARDNIAYGRIERRADAEAIATAARAGGAAGVIEALPARYETVLGRYFEGGQDLSGGQWQKLAIARAYFRDAQILVLDEPTAALDPRAELELFERFRALAGGKTAIFVSHRMASARIADRILVLQQGRLIEMGTHAELLRLGGEYARMFELQSRMYQGALPDGDEPSAPTLERARGAGEVFGA